MKRADRRATRGCRGSCDPWYREGDLIVGTMGRSAIGTLVERSSRFVILAHIEYDHTAETVCDGLITTVAELPAALRRSLTWGQGAELSGHVGFQVTTDVAVYFYDPAVPGSARATRTRMGSYASTRRKAPTSPTARAPNCNASARTSASVHARSSFGAVETNDSMLCVTRVEPAFRRWLQLKRRTTSSYLCAIKDVFSNKIVGYSIDSRMKSSLAVRALEHVVVIRRDVPGPHRRIESGHFEAGSSCAH